MLRGILATLLSAMMVAALASVLVYRWQGNRWSDLLRIERETAERQLREAERQLSECSTALAEIAWSSSGTGAIPCGVLNTDPSNANIAFYDESRGIAFVIPYNESWGYGAQKPEPYISLSGVDGMLFGPPREIGECEWAYTMQLTYMPPRDTQEMRADVFERNALRIESGEMTESEAVPELVDSDGQAAYRYVVPGQCPLINYELLGLNYNYVFSTCEEYEEKLLPVVESVELAS